MHCDNLHPKPSLWTKTGHRADTPEECHQPHVVRRQRVRRVGTRCNNPVELGNRAVQHQDATWTPPVPDERGREGVHHAHGVEVTPHRRQDPRSCKVRGSILFYKIISFSLFFSLNLTLPTVLCLPLQDFPSLVLLLSGF